MGLLHAISYRFVNSTSCWVTWFSLDETILWLTVHIFSSLQVGLRYDITQWLAYPHFLLGYLILIGWNHQHMFFHPFVWDYYVLLLNYCFILTFCRVTWFLLGEYMWWLMAHSKLFIPLLPESMLRICLNNLWTIWRDPSRESSVSHRAYTGATNKMPGQASGHHRCGNSKVLSEPQARHQAWLLHKPEGKRRQSVGEHLETRQREPLHSGVTNSD